MEKNLADAVETIANGRLMELIQDLKVSDQRRS